MPVELLGTGVAISWDASASEVTVQVFAELKDGDEVLRSHGPSMSQAFEPSESATSELLEQASFMRDTNLGNVLGDVRRAGIDVSRWDFYAAPFHMEIDDKLRRLVD